MEVGTQEAWKQMAEIVDGLDDSLQRSFQNMHGGHPQATLARFLKAREGNIPKASKMLIDCLTWRLQNDIDSVLQRPITLINAIRESQLIGMCGYCKKGRPVFAMGVGQSGYDKAPADKYVQSHIQINEYRDRVILPEVSKKQGHYVGTCLKILDMTGLRLSALSQRKILTAISTVDDLNYPEKTAVYYIVNAPYAFTACWKAVKPMLQERTRRKVQVLNGNGREELLRVMDRDTLPMFSRGGSTDGRLKSFKSVSDITDQSLDCFSPYHKFHVELWNYVKENAQFSNTHAPHSQVSLHIQVPSLEDQDKKSESTEVVQAIESTLQTLATSQKGKDQKQTGELTYQMAGVRLSI